MHNETRNVRFEAGAYQSANRLSVYFRDITERVKAENGRKKMTADVMTHHKDVEQFSYIISHNLTAPVAKIPGLSSMLQKDDLKDNLKSEIDFGFPPP